MSLSKKSDHITYSLFKRGKNQLLLNVLNMGNQQHDHLKPTMLAI